MRVLLFFVSVAGIHALLEGESSSLTRDKRQAVRGERLWSNKTMNFYFDKTLPYEFMAMFRDAFEYIESHTCIRFNYDKYADYKVRVLLDETDCYAYFGMQSHNQRLHFAHQCAAFGVAVHEVMHTLGIAHAQSRTDRDEYMVVQDSPNHNDDMQDTVNLVPFDYGSVMLYERNEHRWPLDPEYNFTMGSLRVAFYDMILLNTLYKCNCDGHPQLECQHGGYQNPANCETCLCTDGFKGTLCDEADGTVLEASTEWNSTYFYIIRKTGIEESTKPNEHNFIVTAPPGSIIETQITELSGFFCQRTCDYNGVEIKYKEDRRMTSPLVCCNDDNLWNKTRSTTTNPLVIVKYGSVKGPKLEFRYRYIPGNGTTAAGNGTEILDNELH